MAALLFYRSSDTCSYIRYMRFDLVSTSVFLVLSLQVLAQQALTEVKLMAYGNPFNMANDNGQNIVEIMRHAPGQPANSLHFLGLPQLRLQLTHPGDILHQGYVVSNLPGDVENWRNMPNGPVR